MPKYTVRLINRNRRVLREIESVELPDVSDATLDLIGIGLLAACQCGAVEVINTRGRVVARKFVAAGN